MINLLEETLESLEQYEKTEADVLWVGVTNYFISWGDFKKQADFIYSNGFGGAEIDLSLVVVGKDWWLERKEYDGSEWWELKTTPTTDNRLEVSTLILKKENLI